MMLIPSDLKPGGHQGKIDVPYEPTGAEEHDATLNRAVGGANEVGYWPHLD